MASVKIKAINRLKKWKEKRITLREMSEVTGLSIVFISQIIKNDRGISEASANKIMNAEEP